MGDQVVKEYIVRLRLALPGNNAKGLPDSLTRVRLKDHLCAELQGVNLEAYSRVSFITNRRSGPGWKSWTLLQPPNRRKKPCPACLGTHFSAFLSGD